MIKSLYNVMEIRGVKVYAHWSVLLIGAVVLIGAVSDPSTAIPGLICYYGVILLHECGHMVVAQRKGYPVWSIELYPIWGIARFSEPYSSYDRSVIAWGGVLAQLLVALPVIFVSELVGPSKYASLNTVLGMFGFFSVFIAVFNLIPAPLLDGSIAWGIVPALFKRYVRGRAAKRAKSWES